MKPEASTLVYVSQSLTDREWLNRLLLALAPYERDLGMEIFSDMRSMPSEESWDQARENMLHKAAVAVVLLSRSCLNSNYLTRHEWPRIQTVVNAGLPLIVIPIQRIEIPTPDSREFDFRVHAQRDRDDLPQPTDWLTQDRHHWAGDHQLVLEGLSEAELDNAFAQIAVKIAIAAGILKQEEEKRIEGSVPFHGAAHMTANAILTRRIPDIAWVEIPGGPFVYQQGETRELPTFWIAKYPVTNIQYQCFIDNAGYQEERWWQGLQRPEPEASRWPQSNRPRTNVDWYEAVAFSRWLCARLGMREGEVRLPTEEEWERAARGREGLAYPWGNEYQSGAANVDEKAGNDGPWRLKQTTAVGVYPHGRSPEGVEDLAGMVWEWCVNKDNKQAQIGEDDSDYWRVLRGGSWLHKTANARADSRLGFLPNTRDFTISFRLLSLAPKLQAGG